MQDVGDVQIDKSRVGAGIVFPMRPRDAAHKEGGPHSACKVSPFKRGEGNPGVTWGSDRAKLRAFGARQAPSVAWTDSVQYIHSVLKIASKMAAIHGRIVQW